ncbi:MAG: hypothetical protein WD535_03360 [Thermaerobacterales bacterium]
MKRVTFQSADQDGLAKLEAWLRENSWYDYQVIVQIDEGVYDVDSGHVAFFIDEARAFGLTAQSS